ncbi:MAG: M23 family metallopeptidase [Oleiphilaceae bacterium]|nr:M23 family metallopeptidase [Oleiphilaceae bacterium]
MLTTLALQAETQGPLLQGIWTQGGVVRGEVPIGTKLWLNDQPVAVSNQGHFVLGFGRDAELVQTLKWCSDNNVCASKGFALEPRNYREQRIEGVPQNTVTPPQHVLDRIRDETAQVKESRAVFLENSFFMQPFIAPIDGPITGVYGSRRVYNGVPKRPHYGVDYAAPVGASVRAPADAVITLAHDDMYYSGGTLIMDHGQGLSSTFIHLSEILVKPGQKVKQGEVVAKVGQGGRSTGPHLDWRVNWHQVRMDPQLLIKLGDYVPSAIDLSPQ